MNRQAREATLRHAKAQATQALIVDAAERVLRTKGLARATTKEIAREAGCAEGTLYIHFRDKLDLYLAVLNSRLLPPFLAVIEPLPARAGTRTVEANLVEVAHSALALYQHLLPVALSAFAEPELLVRQRDYFRETGSGPDYGYRMIAEYLRAEQALGRVAADADAEATAVLLLGACTQYLIFWHVLDAERLPIPIEQLATRLVRGLLAGIEPHPGEQHKPAHRHNGELSA